MEAVTPVKVSDDHERIYEEWGKKCLLIEDVLCKTLCRLLMSEMTFDVC